MEDKWHCSQLHSLNIKKPFWIDYNQESVSFNSSALRLEELVDVFLYF